MSWILKWILLYPCDGEMYSPVYLALQFVVMQLFLLFLCKYLNKEKYHLPSVYLGPACTRSNAGRARTNTNTQAK